MKDKVRIKLTRKEIVTIWSMIPYLTLKFSDSDELDVVYGIGYGEIRQCISLLEDLILSDKFSDEKEGSEDIYVEINNSNVGIFSIVDPGNYEDKDFYNLNQVGIEDIFEGLNKKYHSIRGDIQ